MLIALDGHGPLYRQVYRAVRHAILNGEMQSGAALPSTRALAEELGLSRTVILLAYEDLLAEGYTESRVGSGTFVAAQIAPEIASTAGDGAAAALSPPEDHAAALTPFARRVIQQQPESIYRLMRQHERLRYNFEFSSAQLDDQALRTWRQLMAKHFDETVGSYPSTQGDARLRAAIADYVHRVRGVRCSADQVLIANGTQQSLDMLARILLDTGDRALIEDPHYHGARIAFTAAGAQLDFCPVDADGMDITHLPRRRVNGARVAYVTPSHQMPTGAIMSVARRLQLLSWAEKTGAYIIEDDYDSEFRYKSRAIPSLHSLDRHNRVIYLGSFAKALAPSLRMAYLVMPNELIEPCVSVKWLSDLGSTALVQRVLTDFMEGGHYARHIRRLSRRYAFRREALLEALHRFIGDDATVAGAPAGLHTLVWLDRVPARRLPALVKAAASRGVGLHPVTSYYASPPDRAGLMMGHTALTREQITEGVRRLGAVLDRF